MEVLPVIDLKQGQVVRAIAGQRDSYRPIISRLASESSPTAIASVFVAEFGFTQVYVADLDAIAGASPDIDSYRALRGAGLALWIDAGVASAVASDEVAKQAQSLVIGLESLTSLDALTNLLARFGAQRFVFSLDLKHGVPLTQVQAWRGYSPLEVVRAAATAGVRRFIVLDLAAVGVHGGVPTLPLLTSIRAEFPDAELVAGGGVRHMADLRLLAAAGVDSALVASALHDGRITPADLKQLAIANPLRCSSPLAQR